MFAYYTPAKRNGICVMVVFEHVSVWVYMTLVVVSCVFIL